MSFADFIKLGQEKIKVDGFSDTDKATILEALKTVYEGSPTAKAMIDRWISSGKEILIRPDEEPGAVLNSGEVWIGLDFVNRMLYIDNDGMSRKNTLERVLVHELVHALTGKCDDGIGAGEHDRGSLTDYQGETVIEANKIYRELGLPEQNSYIGQNVLGLDNDVLIAGIQYTNGAAINRSVVISNAADPGTIYRANDWDSSPAGNSSDLLIGDVNDNKLEAGDGNDFLYGNVGNDTLDGGEGDDYLEGGADNDQLTGGAGRDTLLGGTGNDKYIEGVDGAIDTIKDTDGQGEIFFAGAILALAGGTAPYQEETEPVSWYSANLTYRRDGKDLYLIRDGHIELVIQEFDFTNGALGLTLGMEAAPAPIPKNPLPASLYHNVTLSTTARDVTTGSYADEVWGSGGNDTIHLGGRVACCDSPLSRKQRPRHKPGTGYFHA